MLQAESDLLVWITDKTAMIITLAGICGVIIILIKKQ